MESVCPRHGLKAFFLVGPTATGKTAVSQWIAERHSCDILSADAMMVYRGLDIGTAKPCLSSRGNVRYWGLDLVSPKEPFSVGVFREYALNTILEITAAGRKVIITGGTGLYIKSLTHGISRLPAGNVAIRAQAEALLKEGGLAALREWVKTQAPKNYEAIADKDNPRRLIRALEVAGVVSGGRQTTWSQVGEGPKIAGLFMPMIQLHERIKQRVKAMYSGGLVDEVGRMLREGLENAPTAGKAIGYAEAIGFLHGKLTLDEAMELTARRTRQLAKRQMTWFRNQANMEWLAIDSGMTTEQIAHMVLDCWQKTGATPIAEGVG